MPRPKVKVNWERHARANLHLTQVRIIDHVAANPNEEWSPLDLAERFDIPLGNVAYHTRRLAAQGVVKLAREEPVRGAMRHVYKKGRLL